ncbi:MAG: hypothetical protein ABJB55_06600 [Actinomycetota bacterium]
MRRRGRIVAGIVLVLVGLFATIAGLAIVLLVGPDGSVGLPPTRLIGTGSAITLPQLDVPALPGHQAIVIAAALAPGDTSMFIGIGPSMAVDAYLRDAPINVIEQIDWPGAARTTAVQGTTTPGPPAGQTFWVTSARGVAPALHWDAEPGDWTLVIMAEHPRSPLDVTVTGSLTIAPLGPIGIGVLILALAVLALGVWITARAAAHAPPAN